MAPAGVASQIVHDLSVGELQRFYREGLLRGRQLYRVEQAATLRDAIRRDVLGVPSRAACHEQFPPDERREFDRHLDSALVYGLCTLPQILAPMRQTLGPDLMVFRSQFFDKRPQGLEVPWHQESYFWTVEKRWVTMWLAVDEVTLRNGVLQVVPGSHERTRQHRRVPATARYWSTFAEAAVAPEYEEVLSCPTPAGGFILMGDVLHRTLANTSDQPRLTFAARYAAPSLERVHDDAYAGHCCVMVSGTSGNSSLRFVEPPTEGRRLAELL